jgi:hypothetical protein
MVIVQINYRRPDMPKAEWDASYTPERAAPFLAVPGLQWKIWLDGADERRAGGIYLFADRAAAEAYVNGPCVTRSTVRSPHDLAGRSRGQFARGGASRVCRP